MNLFSDSTLEQAIRDRAGQLDCSPQDLMAQALEALKNQRRSIYLSAPVNALVEGLYEEDTRIADLKTHGDFGIGTFNDLDGEMVLIDGEVFQLCANGRVVRVDDEIKTPFACACFFKADVDEPVSKPHSYEEFNRLLALCLPSPNMLYACRVDGVFKSVRTRSVPKQDNYRPLVEVTRDQIESTQKNIHGSLVGFYNPPFISSVNVPGWHFHFISDDRTCGGHLLACDIDEGRIALQHHALMQLGLPGTLDYLTLDFSRDASRDLAEAEH